MLQFFKYVLASIVGFILAFFITIFVLFGVVSGIISSIDTTVKTVKPNSILRLKLNQAIPDKAMKMPFENLNIKALKGNLQLGLNDIITDIHHAKVDPNITAIYLDVSLIPTSMASVEEIRNSLIDFKKSKKMIIAYSEVYSQKAYYLASVADSIYMNPEGILFLNGLGAEVFFMKGTLDKLGVNTEVFRPTNNRFKSAVEPFINEKMSIENRIQTKSYMSSIWNQMIWSIGVSRKLKTETINRIADTLGTKDPNDALKLGLLDGLIYKDQLIAKLKRITKVKPDGKLEIVELEDYDKKINKSLKLKIKERDKEKENNKIAVIYASGNILGGEGDEENIGSERFSRAIRNAREDKNIKAIVLRINSPGGGALASEIIWREVSLATKVKPVIASFGGVAASGGYYIGCAADYIVADPTTITGSIGVFGFLFNGKELLNKLGVTTDTVGTNPYSGLGSFGREMTPFERAVIQKGVDRTYHTFLSRVSAGRHIPINYVDGIAQGRVWTGVQAKDKKLVDELGGLSRAIEIASQKAKLTKYTLISLPEGQGSMKFLFKSLTSQMEAETIKDKLGVNYKYYSVLHELTRMNGIQAQLFWNIDIN